jgi:hypothetical protein
VSISKDLQKAYAFFRDNAGYVVGRSAESALTLARAEQWAESNGYTFRWEADSEPDLSWADAKQREQITDVELCVMYDPAGAVVSSLGGVTFAIHNPRELREARAHARVREAELACDRMVEVHTALAEDKRAQLYLAL